MPPDIPQLEEIVLFMRHAQLVEFGFREKDTQVKLSLGELQGMPPDLEEANIKGLGERAGQLKQLIGFMYAHQVNALSIHNGKTSWELKLAGTGPALAGHSDQSGISVHTPISGIFYAAPAPDAPPFVTIGSQVAAGDTLAIIESMKMMNKLPANKAGVVSAIHVANQEPISEGQLLMTLKPIEL